MAVGRPRFTLDFFPLSPPPPTPRRLAGPRGGGGGGASAAAAAVDPSEHAGGSFFRFFPHSFFLSRPSLVLVALSDAAVRSYASQYAHVRGRRSPASMRRIHTVTKRRLGPTRFFNREITWGFGRRKLIRLMGHSSRAFGLWNIRAIKKSCTKLCVT